MKKLAGFALLCIATTGFAAELTTYEAIQTAILAGNTIRIALDFNQCSMPIPYDFANKNFDFSIGVFSPNEIIVKKDDHISASLLHFTRNDRHMPGKSVYQFATYKITKENGVTLTTEVLDPVNFKTLSPGFTFQCPLHIAAKVYQ